VKCAALLKPWALRHDLKTTCCRSHGNNGVIHGHPERHLPGLLNLGFPGIDGDVLIHLLTDVAASQGSSCTSGSFESSHVLRAMGINDDLARASLRFGVGRFNTLDEINRAATAITSTVERAKLATGRDQ
jgi:cysteine desulfurase